VLLALSFPFPSIGIFAWIGIVPLLFALKNSSGKSAFINGIICGFTFFLITIYWIQVFGYVAWFLLALALSLWTGIFAAGTRWLILNCSSLGQVFMIPLLWSIVEYSRSAGPWGFGWANLGSTVANNHIASIASFAGEIGLSYVIALVNVLFFILADSLLNEIIAKKYARPNANIPGNSTKNIPRISIAAISILVLLFISAFASCSENKTVSANSEKLHGKTRNEYLDDNTGSKTISVSMIQPNIPQYVKLNSANNSAIKKIYKEMTLKAITQSKEDAPDMIVWPESVILEYANNDQDYYKGITDTIADHGASFLYGTLTRVGTDTIFNNAVFIDANKKTQVYHKIHLVPFGEYVPARKLVESVNSMAKLVVDKTAGSSYSVFDFQSKHALKHGLEYEQGRNLSNSKQNIRNGQYTKGKFSSIICFESADSALVGRMVRNGARLIIVLTNDGWFGDTAALEQHFRIGRIRAIEYGVPLIQASNTGVSGAIASDGTVLNKALSNKRVILNEKIGFAPKPSFYTSIEPWMPIMLILLFISGLVAFTGNHRASRRANKSYAFLE
jgi:apolipoprotein N-acyltransferase